MFEQLLCESCMNNFYLKVVWTTFMWKLFEQLLPQTILDRSLIQNLCLELCYKLRVTVQSILTSVVVLRFCLKGRYIKVGTKYPDNDQQHRSYYRWNLTANFILRSNSYDAKFSIWIEERSTLRVAKRIINTRLF